jgi:peptidoglycan/LPS O-acetylase OafA/YrhL
MEWSFAVSTMSQPTLYPPKRGTQYIPALTGLRALAAYSVFLHHYNPAPAGTFAYHLYRQGYVGVSVFFVLSGFLIYHRYADAYLTRRNWAWRTYWHQRFARLMPLYLLLLAVTMIGQYVTGHGMSGPELLLNLTLLKGFFNEYKFSGLAQSWSLTVEWTFYLLAPWLFSALYRWGIIRLTIGLFSVGLLLWVTIGQADWHGVFGTLPFVLFYTFFGRVFEFLIGMHLARRWRLNKVHISNYDLIISVILIGCCVMWQASVSTVFSDDSTKRLLSEFVTYNLLLPVGIMYLLLSLLRETSSLHRLLASPVFQALGRSSYAFYLIHIGVVSRVLLRTGLIGNNWLLFGVLVLLAHGVYIGIERPIHRWLAPNRLQASPSIP